MTAALARHLISCRQARSRWFFALLVRDAVTSFVVARSVTALTLVIVTSTLALSLY